MANNIRCINCVLLGKAWNEAKLADFMIAGYGFCGECLKGRKFSLGNKGKIRESVDELFS